MSTACMCYVVLIKSILRRHQSYRESPAGLNNSASSFACLALFASAMACSSINVYKQQTMAAAINCCILSCQIARTKSISRMLPDIMGSAIIHPLNICPFHCKCANCMTELKDTNTQKNTHTSKSLQAKLSRKQN